MKTFKELLTESTSIVDDLIKDLRTEMGYNETMKKKGVHRFVVTSNKKLEALKDEWDDGGRVRKFMSPQVKISIVKSGMDGRKSFLEIEVKAK